MASAQTKIRLAVGDKTVTATLVDNEATCKLASLLADGPITLRMEDYGGFEKVGALPQSLPTSNRQITTEPGDIMLYQGNQMVIFYGANTWSYTRLGKIDGATATNVRQFLGNGSISLTVSLNSPSGIEEVGMDKPCGAKVYDLKGNLIEDMPLAAGIYIVNGVKTMIR